jgi:hypothetical protein
LAFLGEFVFKRVPSYFRTWFHQPYWWEWLKSRYVN